MSRILCIGEVMLELSRAGADDEGALFRLGYAGDSFNTAWYLRHLLGAGHSVAYLTRIGIDPHSDGFVEFATQSGICTQHVQRDTARGMGLYAISLENGERRFSYWRGQSAARHLADADAPLDAAMKGADIVYVSGITLAIIGDEGRARLAAAVDAAKSRGSLVIFDPNLRPALWPDADEMRRAVMGFAARADWVLPSFDDEHKWFGDAGLGETAARYRQAGAGVVLVKNAGAEILLADGSRVELISGLDKVQPVDSTAAGDSFNAGLIAGMVEGQSLEDSIAQAHALAQRVVLQHGALCRAAL